MYRSAINVVVLAVLVSSIALFAAGCGSQSPTRQAPVPAELATGLPALQTLAEPKAASGTYQVLHPGSATSQLGPGAAISGDYLELDGESLQMAWGIYAVWIGTRIPEEFIVELDVESAPVYIALSDYTRGCWSFHGPVDGTYAPLATDTGDVSPGGYTYVAVVAGSGAAATVRAIHLRINREEYEWDRHIVAWDPAVRPYLSMFVIDGKPMVAYRSENDESIMFARALNTHPDSMADWHRHKVVPTGVPRPDYVGLSAERVDGRPAMVFADFSTDNIHYAWAGISEPGGAGDWLHYVLDAGDDQVRAETAIADINGIPWIAFGRNYTARIARASSATPAMDDWTVMEFTSGYPLQKVPSIREIGNRPALAYTASDLAGSHYFYSRATVASPAGPADWAAHVVEDYEDAGWECDLGLLFRKPDSFPMAVSRWGPSSMGPLRFAGTSEQFPGSPGDWNCHTVDSQAMHPQLLSLNYTPAIVYYQRSSETIRLARSTVGFPAAMEDWEIENIAEVQTSYTPSSAAVWAGKVYVVYREAELHYLMCASRQF